MRSWSKQMGASRFWRSSGPAKPMICPPWDPPSSRFPQLASLKHTTTLFEKGVYSLDAIEEICKKKKIGFMRIDGSTPMANRQIHVNDFQTNPYIRV